MEQKVTCLINFLVLLFRIGLSSKNFGNGSKKKRSFLHLLIVQGL